MYTHFLRPILFRLSPERIHNLTFTLFNFAQKIPGIVPCISSLYQNNQFDIPVEVFGLKFKNPVGLAAGLDKNGEALKMLSTFGFSFIETGTVTPIAQPGNSLPRLFRLTEDEALVNRMGFNNLGAIQLRRKLEKNQIKNCHIAINIGKNKTTSNTEAYLDYLKCVDELHELAAFFVVNISSPNTPNLRDLQEREPLTKILSEIQNRIQSKSNVKPILLKISPDLSFNQITEILSVIEKTAVRGIIATNTTISRENLNSNPTLIEQAGEGGLSGKPLRKRSTEIIQFIHNQTNGLLPIIGVGGILDEESALEKLHAGASLIEIYTGFIYKGPSLVSRINRFIKSSNNKS